MNSVKVLVNMISLFQGGARTVGHGILEGIAELPIGEVTWLLILPKGAGYENSDVLSRSDLKAIFVRYPRKRLSFAWKLFYDHIYTWYIANSSRSDIIFMTANFPCLLTRRTQVVLQHNILYLLDGEESGIKSLRFRLEKALFTLGIQRNKNFIVQLRHVKSLLLKKFTLSEDRIHVVTMVPPSQLRSSGSEDETDIEKLRHYDHLKLFFPAKMYPNKNHRILVSVGERIKQRGLNVKIYITLDSKQCKMFIDEVVDAGLSDVIVNLGEIPPEKIRRYYEVMNCLFFPTSAESYGMPYVEAILHKMPVLTSDLPFAREVCGDGGFYFDLGSPDSIVECIEQCSLVYGSRELLDDISCVKKRYTHTWADIVKEFITFFEYISSY